MASGGSSDRNSGPRSFVFGSDDVLCAYDDLTNQDPTSGRRSDPSPKDFHESRVGRPLIGLYGQQDEYPKEEIITAVEKCMKKYADNLLRHLEGISGRLSQLEIYCYKLERAIGEFRADMIRDQGEADSKFKSLEKHLQEVHRSIQVLRDKQELAETQKELTKLQLVPKESATPIQSQKSEEAPQSSSDPESKQHIDAADVCNPHLALALPHQIPPPSSRPSSNPQQLPSYVPNQHISFYPQQTQQALQPEPQYMQLRPQQIQEPSFQAPPPQQPPATPPPPPPPPQMVNHAQPPQSYPQYQHQQWSHPSSHQFSQQVVAPPQQPTPQPQLVRPHTPFGYSPVPQSSGSHTEAVPFGYGAPSGARNMSSRPQPQLNFGGYGSAVAPYQPQSNLQGYSAVYNIDGGRVQSYAPPSTGSGFHQHQMMRSHPHGDVIEKAASMGYPREQIVGVVDRMAESGQPVDFNALLDRLNPRAGAGAGAGGPPAAWSG